MLSAKCWLTCFMWQINEKSVNWSILCTISINSNNTVQLTHVFWSFESRFCLDIPGLELLAAFYLLVYSNLLTLIFNKKLMIIDENEKIWLSATRFRRTVYRFMFLKVIKVFWVFRKRSIELTFAYKSDLTVLEGFLRVLSFDVSIWRRSGQVRSQDLEKGGGYFERVRSVQTTLTRIFIDLESVSDNLSEIWDEMSRKDRKLKVFSAQN